MPTTGRRVSRPRTVVPRRFGPCHPPNRPSRHNQEPLPTPPHGAALLWSTPHLTPRCSSVLLPPLPPLLHPAEQHHVGCVNEEERWACREPGPASGDRRQRVRSNRRPACAGKKGSTLAGYLFRVRKNQDNFCHGLGLNQSVTKIILVFAVCGELSFRLCKHRNRHVPRAVTAHGSRRLALAPARQCGSRAEPSRHGPTRRRRRRPRRWRLAYAC